MINIFKLPSSNYYGLVSTNSRWMDLGQPRSIGLCNVIRVSCARGFGETCFFRPTSFMRVSACVCRSIVRFDRRRRSTVNNHRKRQCTTRWWLPLAARLLRCRINPVRLPRVVKQTPRRKIDFPALRTCVYIYIYYRAPL